MQLIKNALSGTSAHGLSRVTSNKPIYVRLTWLLIFLIMFGLFLKGLVEFVEKLRVKKVTSSIESDGVKFRFPDIFACFENPISSSYSATLDYATASAINTSFSMVDKELQFHAIKENLSQENTAKLMIENSFVYVFGLSYKLLFDSLAHRVEQSLISSTIVYMSEIGDAKLAEIEAYPFNHPQYLRCLRWTINRTWQDKMTTVEAWAGLTITLLLDTSGSLLELKGGYKIPRRTFIPDGSEIPISDWTLAIKDYKQADRPIGLKVFLSPPGEYPSDFVSSFSLGPGRYHTVEIKMSDYSFKEDQFKCIGDGHPAIQFTNPYDLSAYSHVYSYSYCYYYEYHRLNQLLLNLSGNISPLPWPLRDFKYMFNISSRPHYGSMDYEQSVWDQQGELAEKIRETCKQKRPCSTLDYSASVSSADWPTHSSLAPFINSSVRQAWMRAKDRNLSVPALDFLLTSNSSRVASYVRDNLLKVHFKPSSVSSDKVTFSIDYGFSNFVSEVGGIMGIYLGMSLLTLCELLELLYDIFARYCLKNDNELPAEK